MTRVSAFCSILIGRNASPALTYGAMDELGTHIEELVAFKQKYQNEELLVLHNGRTVGQGANERRNA